MEAPNGWGWLWRISYRKPPRAERLECDGFATGGGKAGLSGKGMIVSEPNAQHRKPQRMTKRIAFLASDAPVAQTARATLIGRYGDAEPAQSDVIVALGGDGFMLRTLHDTQHLDVPVYGMNRGTIGFLMNEYSETDLLDRLSETEEEVINPLSMRARDRAGRDHAALAINEVSLLRAGPQAAWLKITVDGRVRMAELVCDGALLATPAGSTAYNYSAHGPILPIGADVLALTAIAAFRPRRWRGALLPKSAHVRFDVLDPVKRPVMADADSISIKDIDWVEIRSEPAISHRILFDPGHGLEERLISEQFS
ncbi:NAD kinase [Cribrihabitans marinus]|nr:NAD kinase [Cribrihabitans marinus]